MDTSKKLRIINKTRIIKATKEVFELKITWEWEEMVTQPLTDSEHPLMLAEQLKGRTGTDLLLILSQGFGKGNEAHGHIHLYNREWEDETSF